LAFDYDFLTNLALVVVPTIIGVIGSNFLINAWQIRKEKFALRKEIISSFHDSFWKANALPYNLFLRISTKYSSVARNAAMTDTSVDSEWIYPSKEEDKPYSVFSKDYNDYITKSSEIIQKSHQFTTMLNFYFDESEKMDSIIDVLNDSLENTSMELKRLVYAKNLQEVTTSVPILIEHHKNNMKLLADLDFLLMKEPLKNPQESMFNFSFKGFFKRK